MVNPFEWLFEQLASTIHFLSAHSWGQLALFFGPALLLDFPRFVLTNAVVFVKEMLFPENLEDTEWARRLRGKGAPLVSVVIAGYNEEKTVEKCIRSLLENTYQKKEIIVIDDGSTDGMQAVCRRLVKKYGIFYARHEERCGKSSGVNHGLRLARGEFVLVGDADTTFDRDAIMQSMLPFVDPGVGAVSANIRVRNVEHNFLTRLQAIEYNAGVGLGRRFMAWMGILANVSGAFGMFRKEVLEAVGGNDIGPGEDFDAVIKVRKAGWRIPFAPRAICMTNVPETVKAFVKQRIRWDQTTVRFRMRKHRDLFEWPPYDLATTIAVFDVIFYDVVLLLVRIPYYLILFAAKPQLILTIAFATWIFYFLCDCMQFAMAWGLSERKREDFWLVFLLPFFSIFSFFYGFVRLYSYIDEFFFYSSFRDRYVPDRVQRQVSA